MNIPKFPLGISCQTILTRIPILPNIAYSTYFRLVHLLWSENWNIVSTAASLWIFQIMSLPKINVASNSVSVIPPPVLSFTRFVQFLIKSARFSKMLSSVAYWRRGHFRKRKYRNCCVLWATDHRRKLNIRSTENQWDSYYSILENNFRSQFWLMWVSSQPLQRFFMSIATLYLAFCAKKYQAGSTLFRKLIKICGSIHYSLPKTLHLYSVQHSFGPILGASEPCMRVSRDTQATPDLRWLNQSLGSISFFSLTPEQAYRFGLSAEMVLIWKSKFSWDATSKMS